MVEARADFYVDTQRAPIPLRLNSQKGMVDIACAYASQTSGSMKLYADQAIVHVESKTYIFNIENEGVEDEWRLRL